MLSGRVKIQVNIHLLYNFRKYSVNNEPIKHKLVYYVLVCKFQGHSIHYKHQHNISLTQYKIYILIWHCSPKHFKFALLLA